MKAASIHFSLRVGPVGERQRVEQIGTPERALLWQKARRNFGNLWHGLRLSFLRQQVEAVENPVLALLRVVGGKERGDQRAAARQCDPEPQRQ